MPFEMVNKSLLIVVDYGIDSVSQTYFESSFEVLVRQSKGTLRVVKEMASVSGAYVKVFSKTNNGIEFYKDGYTDPRGNFDYASLSNDSLNRVLMFSLLVKHKDLGEQILEICPPN